MRLRPFTDFDPAELGAHLSGIVSKEINDRLLEDYPSIRNLYGDPKRATRTIKQRQAEMRRNRRFAALVVFLGTTRETARICGVTTMLVRRRPNKLWSSGTHTAVWLDADRERELKGAGETLFEARWKWLLDRPAFTGPMWTVIREDNKASRSPWEKGAGYPLVLKPVGRPRSYERLDGVRVPRQLYESKLTLEQLRKALNS